MATSNKTKRLIQVYIDKQMIDGSVASIRKHIKTKNLG